MQHFHGPKEFRLRHTTISIRVEQCVDAVRQQARALERGTFGAGDWGGNKVVWHRGMSIECRMNALGLQLGCCRHGIQMPYLQVECVFLEEFVRCKHQHGFLRAAHEQTRLHPFIRFETQ